MKKQDNKSDDLNVKCSVKPQKEKSQSFLLLENAWNAAKNKIFPFYFSLFVKSNQDLIFNDLVFFRKWAGHKLRVDYLLGMINPFGNLAEP